MPGCSLGSSSIPPRAKSDNYDVGKTYQSFYASHPDVETFKTSPPRWGDPRLLSRPQLIKRLMVMHLRNYYNPVIKRNEQMFSRILLTHLLVNHQESQDPVIPRMLYSDVYIKGLLSGLMYRFENNDICCLKYDDDKLYEILMYAFIEDYNRWIFNSTFIEPVKQEL